MNSITAQRRVFGRDEAVKTLQYYFRRAFEAGGLKWDFDNDAEIEYIVDMLMQATEV